MLTAKRSSFLPPTIFQRTLTVHSPELMIRLQRAFPLGSKSREVDCGQAWVVLCGVHPEAQEMWRTGTKVVTFAHDKNNIAGTLIDAALQATSLPYH